IVALTSGVFLLSLRGGGDLPHLNRRAVPYPLFTRGTHRCFPLGGGLGAPPAANAHSYALWLFVIDGAFITLIAVLPRGPAAVPAMAKFLKSGLAGGVRSLTA